MTNTYDEHDHLNDAKRVCANESQCIGIFEGGCNKNGPFKLTKRGFMTSVSGANCIYKKKKYGKRLLVAIKHKFLLYQGNKKVKE